MTEEFPEDIQQPMPGVQSSAPDMLDVNIPKPLNDTLESKVDADEEVSSSLEDLKELQILKDNLEDYFRDCDLTDYNPEEHF